MAETTALGSRLDLGGQWIGHDHHRIMALAAELGATRYPMHTGTAPQVIDGGRRLPLASPSVLPAGAALAGVGVLSLTGTPERWNDTTVDACLRKVPGRVSRRLLEVIASISWTADLDRYSVHAMARMVRQQGGLRTILSTRCGAQDSLLVEGVGTLTDRLAAELGGARTHGAPGDPPRTGRARGHRAHRGRYVPGGAEHRHRTAAGRGPDRAPPAAPGRPGRAGAEHVHGLRVQGVAVFERPFWRDRGRAEFLVLDSPGRAVFDTGSPGGPGHLCTLVAGPEARALDDLDAEERRQVLLAPLVPHLGTGVLKPVSWHEKAWHLDEHAGGGYVVLPEPGTTEGISPLPHAPLGPVHWTGTETADEHAGYLEGAIAIGGTRGPGGGGDPGRRADSVTGRRRGRDPGRRPAPVTTCRCGRMPRTTAPVTGRQPTRAARRSTGATSALSAPPRPPGRTHSPQGPEEPSRSGRAWSARPAPSRPGPSGAPRPPGGRGRRSRCAPGS